MKITKPCHPDKITGISYSVYLMQLRQLPVEAIKTAKRRELAELVLKERKIDAHKKKEAALKAKRKLLKDYKEKRV